mmetsp:Transcript_41568/g.98539  ORF Transcript_41568/g.98539 Transcript_41568/m.98539 type:complete len:100 (+) Transcript_41568:457-756(+)
MAIRIDTSSLLKPQPKKVWPSTSPAGHCSLPCTLLVPGDFQAPVGGLELPSGHFIGLPDCRKLDGNLRSGHKLALLGIGNPSVHCVVLFHLLMGPLRGF